MESLRVKLLEAYRKSTREFLSPREEAGWFLERWNLETSIRHVEEVLAWLRKVRAEEKPVARVGK